MSPSRPSSTSGHTAASLEGEPPVDMNEMSDLEKQRLSPKQEAARLGGPGGNDLYQPRSLKFWLTLLFNFLALFLVALDRTIVATAIPRITDEFKSLGDIGWYGSAYMLTTACSQLIYGRLYKFYDMKWTFLISIVVFEIGSAICGAAASSGVFIAGRAIAGVASAGIFSGCMMVTIPMIPLHKRPMFQGMFGMIFGIASVMGPLIGGGFTSAVSWRWCFYINLPIGAVSLVFMVLFWNPPKQKHEPVSPGTHFKRLDPLGMLFFLPSVVSLLLALQWGGSTYPWKDGRIIALFVIFGVLFLAFAAVQILKPETAAIPPRVITQRSIFCGALFTFFLAGSMLMLVYFVPVWFQTVKFVNPIKSGIYTLPLLLSLVASSMMSGLLTQKMGYYAPAMYFSPAVLSIGEGLMSTFNRGSNTSHWVGYQFVAGFGLGAGMQTANLAVQTVLPHSDVSTGIAIMFFLQQLGGAVFTSVGQTILSNLLVSKLSGIPGLDSDHIVNEGATSLVANVPPQFLDLVVQAYNYACTRIFLTAMGLSLVALLSALPIEWRSIKKGKNGQERPGGPGGPEGPRGADVAPPGAQRLKDLEPKPATTEKAKEPPSEESTEDSITGETYQRDPTPGDLR